MILTGKHLPPFQFGFTLKGKTLLSDCVALLQMATTFADRELSAIVSETFQNGTTLKKEIGLSLSLNILILLPSI